MCFEFGVLGGAHKIQSWFLYNSDSPGLQLFYMCVFQYMLWEGCFRSHQIHGAMCVALRGGSEVVSSFQLETCLYCKSLWIIASAKWHVM